MLRKFVIGLLVFFIRFIPGWSQTDSTIILSLPDTNLKLSELLDEISKSSVFEFSYNPNRIPLDTLIILPEKNIELYEILKIFGEYGVYPEIQDQHIVLKKKLFIPEPELPSYYILRGYLYDSQNHEALIGASVVISETGKGVTTNGYGFFSLKMEEGDYEVLFSYIGYSSQKKKVALISDIQMDQYLVQLSTELEEVKIVSDEFTRTGNNKVMGKVELPVKSIRKMPGFLGETDVIKSLQSVPGVSFYSDGSTIFHVRGGARDQNLLLIDEAPVYNPAHMLGIFSVFTPEALNSVEIYKGDMPAKYGGRLASVIDVKMKEGNARRFQFSGNTGPVATSLNLEAPLLRKRGSFYLSGRRSHLKWILGEGNSSVEKLYFTDLNLKANYRINDNNRLFFFLFSGVDKLQNRSGEYSSNGIFWQNIAANIRWNSVIRNKLFVNTSLIFSEYNYNLYLSYELNNRWNTQIGLQSLKSDFTWYIDPSNTLGWGFGLSSHKYAPGHFLSGNNTVPLAAGVENKFTLDHTLYLNYKQSFGERSAIDYGVRFVGWRNIGPGSEFVYNSEDEITDTLNYGNEVYHKMLSIEPRVNYSIKINERWQGKLSLSRNAQFEHLISNSISPFTSLEVWLPAGPNIDPMYSDQVSAGFTWKSRRHPVYFNAEFFIKKMTNYISYVDHPYMLFNPQVDREILYGKGRSYGGEFILKKTQGRWDGWLSYVYTRTLVRIPGINDGNEFYSRYDRPHNIMTGIFFQARPRFRLSANWVYMTGSPFTTPTGYYYYNGYQVPYYNERNNDRLPPYHRLDLGCEIRLNKTGSEQEHTLRISFFNLYGRKNPFSINFNKIVDEDGNIAVPADLNIVPDLTPTMMYIYGVIPSLSYHFKF